MKLHFLKIITILVLILFFSCLKTEDLNINGTWNLNSMQCNTYNFYKEYKLILTENDSLGKNAIIILPSNDSLKTEYVLYNNEAIEFTNDTIGDWQGKHSIKKWTANSLNFTIQSDSCLVLFQFKR